MIDELISKNAAIRLIDDTRRNVDVYDIAKGLDWAKSLVQSVPTVDAEPKPMHWIDTAECRFKYSMDSRFRCSVCGKGYDFKHRFCPNCGKKADNPSGAFLKVKMDEVAE